MHINYNDRTDLLYLRLDLQTQDVINQEVAEGIVVDIGKNNRIVGIEIMDASKRMDLNGILPLQYDRKAA